MTLASVCMPVVWCRYLVRAQPEGPWSGQKVLELGCGTGQLGIVLALAGAAITVTDLAHIVPLTQTNVNLNVMPACLRLSLPGLE
jgi:predicted RNA methylase